jgi:hypothetical protein
VIDHDPRSRSERVAWWLRQNDPETAARELGIYDGLPAELTQEDVAPLLPYLADEGLTLEAEPGAGWIVVSLDPVPAVVVDPPTARIPAETMRELVEGGR